MTEKTLCLDDDFKEEHIRYYIPLAAYKAREYIAAWINSDPDRFVLYEPYAPHETKKYGYKLYRVNGKGELERI